MRQSNFQMNGRTQCFLVECCQTITFPPLSRCFLIINIMCVNVQKYFHFIKTQLNFMKSCICVCVCENEPYVESEKTFVAVIG